MATCWRNWRELTWPLQGRIIPRDHGYALFGALCTHIPWMRDNSPLRVAPVEGLPSGKDTRITGKSRLIIRAPSDCAGKLKDLNGKALDINYCRIELGDMEEREMQPAGSLHSRLVVLKSSGKCRHRLDDFWQPLARQVERLAGSLDGVRVDIGSKARMRMHHYWADGFSVAIRGMSPEASMVIQALGVGAKGHMGCGFFR
jgi:CRISPR-associated protein Cas6